jgi:hypothetical protein
MKALLCSAVCAFGLLGAVGAQAHDHDSWHGRGGDWHDHGGHDHGWHRGWEGSAYRPYGYRYYGYAPRYYVPAYPHYHVWHEGYYPGPYAGYPSYDSPRAYGGAQVVLSFPLF